MASHKVWLRQLILFTTFSVDHGTMWKQNLNQDLTLGGCIVFHVFGFCRYIYKPAVSMNYIQ